VAQGGRQASAAGIGRRAVESVGRQATLKLLRGNTAVDMPVTIGERPAR